MDLSELSLEDEEFVSVRISVALIKRHDQKQPGEERLTTSRSHAITEGSQGRNGSRGLRGTLRIGSLFMAWSVSFLKHPRTSHPGLTSPAVSWALPHQPLIKKTGLPTGQSYGRIFSTALPVSQIALTCVKLTKNPTRTGSLGWKVGHMELYAGRGGEGGQSLGAVETVGFLLQWQTRKGLSIFCICLSGF